MSDRFPAPLRMQLDPAGPPAVVLAPPSSPAAVPGGAAMSLGVHSPALAGHLAAGLRQGGAQPLLSVVGPGAVTTALASLGEGALRLHAPWSHPDQPLPALPLPAGAELWLLAPGEDGDGCGEPGRPVAFLEPTYLGPSSGAPEEAGGDPTRTLRRGDRLTLLCHAATVATALEATAEGVEVLEMRRLWPVPEPPVLESVRRTGRLLVAGAGEGDAPLASSLCALATAGAFEWLDAPPVQAVADPRDPLALARRIEELLAY